MPEHASSSFSATIHTKDKLDYLETDAGELFLGTGELGTSIFFASAADELAGKLLLSGAHGDKMWDRGYREPVDAKIRRSPYPDTAKKAFRLHVEFINYPPAFLTAMIQPEINRISRSEELADWCLNNDYDRPIPRRIVEDAGVPRTEFGFLKDGGAGFAWAVRKLRSTSYLGVRERASEDHVARAGPR